MKIQAGQTVILAGASGGLGVFMARAFADFKTKLALAAHPGAGLDAVSEDAKRRGAQTSDLFSHRQHSSRRLGNGLRQKSEPMILSGR